MIVPTEDGLAILARILDEPDEDLHRLVFADWVEEQGDPHRAEFIRLQIEADTLPVRLLLMGRVQEKKRSLSSDDPEEFHYFDPPMWRPQTPPLQIESLQIEFFPLPGTGEIHRGVAYDVQDTHRDIRHVYSGCVVDRINLDNRADVRSVTMSVTGKVCPHRARFDYITKRLDELKTKHSRDWLVPLVAAMGLSVERDEEGNYQSHGTDSIAVESHRSLFYRWQRGFIHSVEGSESALLCVAPHLFLSRHKSAASTMHPVREATAVFSGRRTTSHSFYFELETLFDQLRQFGVKVSVKERRSVGEL